MKKYISRSRRAYVKMYRWLRLNGGSYTEEIVSPGLSDAQDCALLSYDNRDHYFFGWANVQRWRIWKDKIYNRWPEKELPF